MTEKFDTINNSIILNLLNEIREYVFNNTEVLEKASRVSNKDALYYTSLDYLHKCQNENIKKFEFAEHENLVNISNIDETLNEKFKKLKHYVRGQSLAIAALYPHNGFISWHHNGNSHGYSVLFSYSIDGNGDFSYYDYDTHNIVTVKDVAGWSVKFNYFPDNFLTSKVFWHCAKTSVHRISIGFQIDKDDVSYVKNLLRV